VRTLTLDLLFAGGVTQYLTYRPPGDNLQQSVSVIRTNLIKSPRQMRYNLKYGFLDGQGLGRVYLVGRSVTSTRAACQSNPYQVDADEGSFMVSESRL